MAAIMNGINGSSSKKRSADMMMMSLGFSENDMKGTIKLKSSEPRKKPRNNISGRGWKEKAEEVEKSDEKTFKYQVQQQSQGVSPPSPVVTQLDEKDLQLLAATGRPPQNDEIETVVCKHCKRPVIKNVATAHVKACLRLKSEKAKERKKAKEAAAAAAAAAGKSGEGSTEGGASGKEIKSEDGAAGTAVGGEESAKMKKGAKKMAKKSMDAEVTPKKKTKKEKAAEEEGKEPKQPKQKKKKEKPVKPEPKPKAPVDVEKQCGVPLPNGALCARSLTCKSHSMGAKRAVHGRSQPYDVLLAAYQRKNQAKQQKAAIQAGAPHPEEGEGSNLPVDSDEETELVMAGVARANPQPFVQSIMIPAKQRFQYQRLKLCSQGVFKPPVGGRIFGARNTSDGMDILSNPNSALGDVSGIMNDVQMGNHGPFGTELDTNTVVPMLTVGPQFQAHHGNIGGPSQQYRTQPMVLG